MATHKDTAERKSELAQHLIQAYRDGTLTPGEMLLPVRDLSTRYRISRGTVAIVLKDLVAQGILRNVPRVGIFVAGNTPSNRISGFEDSNHLPENSKRLSHHSLIVPTALDPRAAAESRNCLVAVVMPDHSFFDRCMDHLFTQAESSGLSVVCHMVKPIKGGKFPSIPKYNHPMRFIIFRYDLMPLAKKLIEQGHRVVLVGAPPAGVIPEVPCVYGDHNNGAYQVMSHLIKLGHRHIALPDKFAGSIRAMGHQQALQKAEHAGIAMKLSALSDAQQEKWRLDPTLAAAFFRNPDAPTAVIAWNDHEAVKLVATLNQAGVSIPGEVSVMGYDALPEGEHLNPALTTVDHEIDRQLQAAVSLLLAPTPPPQSHTVVVLSTLVVRGSSGPCKLHTSTNP